MYYLKIICIALFLSANIFFQVSFAIDFQETLGHLKSKKSPDVQAKAAFDVIARLLPDKAHLFSILVDISTQGTKDTFYILKEQNSDVVHVRGSTGVAAVWGVHHYLKHFCGCHINWEYSQQLHLPEPLPNINLSISSQDWFRYYQNVCTSSYSFAWWQWPQWERHLDWMALNGINLPLAFVGQEAIWENVWLKFGLTLSEINEHFTGPAFFAWGRMGNIRGWGGPLPSSWHSQTLKLQHKILKRMRDLGMIPVLPAFAGHVPRAITRLFPGANFTTMGTWNHFENEYCCPYLVSPEDPLFLLIGSMFMEEMLQEFGTNHIYNCDTFNEMSPRSGDESYLAAVGKATFAAMTAVDPSAVWMLQGWMFHDSFWTESRARALLTSVVKGRMLVLDLQSELNEQYTRLHSYFGQPFIWCMLHNFGGTLGLYGAAERVNQGVHAGRSLPNGTMVGTGLTPEGINQNYVMYDLMLEMSLRDSPVDLPLWFENYSVRRYGARNINTTQAWQHLRRSTYNFNDTTYKVRGKYILCRRPSLKLKPTVWYNASEVIEAWDKLVGASHYLPTSHTLLHDLVDVGRQSLQLLAAHFYSKMMSAYRRTDIQDFSVYSAMLLRLLADMDVLLASSPDFLLGSWVHDARSWGYTEEEKDLYEFNARNQITLWGPRGEILDYANKQWAGVVSHYFKPRWALFVQQLNHTLQKGSPFNQTDFNILVFNQVEKPFTLDKTSFSIMSEGDPLFIAIDVHKRWRPLYKRTVAKAFRKQWFSLRKRKLSVVLPQ